MIKILLPLCALVILSGCAPADTTTDNSMDTMPAGKRAAMEWQGEQTGTGEFDTPETTLKLVVTDSGEELFSTTCTGTFSPSTSEVEPFDGKVPLSIATCWWAGGGDEYGAFIGAADELTIMHRTVDEEAGFGVWEEIEMAE